MTRLDNPKTGAIIIVAQRLHEDDLPGRLIATGQYEVLELPAIEVSDRKIALPDGRTWTRSKGDILLPGHMDKEDLEAKRREIGSAKFEAQFQQAPVPGGGNIIKPEWFGTYPPGMRRQDYEGIIQSWDTAAIPGESNDFSVCTTWGLLGNYVDLLDVYRERQLYPDLLRDARSLAAKWKPDLIVIEKSSTGLSLKPDLQRAGLKQARWLSTEKPCKVERMVAQSSKLEQGQVRLPPSSPSKERFVGEAVVFPNGKHDDQVDSMSQALRALDHRPFELRHCSRFKG
jgi:predicted phage terminase large subunit-like protein